MPSHFNFATLTALLHSRINSYFALKNFSAVLLLTISFCSHSQTYLNKIYPSFGGGPESAILFNDSNYLVISHDIQNLWDLNFGKFDLNGNLKDVKSYSSKFFPSLCENCFEKRDNIYYYAHTQKVRKDSIHITLWKIDEELDTISTMNIYSFDGIMPKVYDLEFDSDSTFIISGYLYNRDTNGIVNFDLFVAKIDTSFNVVWHSKVKDSYQHLHSGYHGKHILIDDYENIIISGHGNDVAFFIDTVHYSFVASFDNTTGNLNWINDILIKPGNSHFAIADHGDGTYRFAQKQYLHIKPRSYMRPDSNQVRFGAMDTLGNVLWDTLLGPKYGYFNFRDLQHTADGNYYIAGEDYRAPNMLSAGFKISPEGDSLWMRTYLYQDSVDASHIWSYQETPDSGFVHFGLYGDQDFDLDPQRLQYSWLLKTDKHGCVRSGCETISIEEEKVTSGKNILIYPNPSTGQFTISIADYDYKEGIELTIYTLNGKKIHSAELNGSMHLVEWPHARTGNYFLKLSGPNNLHYGKIIQIK